MIEETSVRLRAIATKQSQQWPCFFVAENLVKEVVKMSYGDWKAAYVDKEKVVSKWKNEKIMIY